MYDELYMYYVFCNNTHTYNTIGSPVEPLSAMISISTLIHKVACFLPEGLLQWNPILWVCIAGLMNSHIQACFWGCPLVDPTNTWQTLPISCHWGDDFPFVARHIGRVPGGWHLNDFPSCEVPWHPLIPSESRAEEEIPIRFAERIRWIEQVWSVKKRYGGIIWKSVAISMSVFKIFIL